MCASDDVFLQDHDFILLPVQRPSEQVTSTTPSGEVTYARAESDRSAEPHTGPPLTEECLNCPVQNISRAPLPVP